MSYYAFLNEQNIVSTVIVGVDDLIDGLQPEIWYANFTGQVCKKTGNTLRKQYAGIGYTYDAVADVFIAPKPYLSWSLDANFDWQAPTPMPTEGFWIWDELTLTWAESTFLGNSD